MSRLVETIRVEDGRLNNIEYHFKRMNNTHVDKVLSTQLPSKGIYKLRIVYDENYFDAEITPYTIKPVRSLKLVFDDKIIYDRKYKDRSAIERLMQLRENCDDVLIVQNNLITDVSYANIIFRDGDTWYTPDSFLLNGTMRQYLLDNERIKERRITVDNIREFTHFKLINAMLRDEAPESEVLNIR